jgi:hypothetical protein
VARQDTTVGTYANTALAQPPPKPSRSEEARRIIEEYVAELREIIKKFRGNLN